MLEVVDRQSGDPGPVVDPGLEEAVALQQPERFADRAPTDRELRGNPGLADLRAGRQAAFQDRGPQALADHGHVVAAPSCWRTGRHGGGRRVRHDVDASPTVRARRARRPGADRPL